MGLIEGKSKYYVYVLLSQKDGKLNIGSTGDLKRRIREHLRGEVKSTAFRRPFILIHYEYFINKFDSEAREKYLKSGYGHRNLYAMLKRTLKFDA